METGLCTLTQLYRYHTVDALCTFGASLPLKEAKITRGDVAMVRSWVVMTSVESYSNPMFPGL